MSSRWWSCLCVGLLLGACEANGEDSLVLQRSSADAPLPAAMDGGMSAGRSTDAGDADAGLTTSTDAGPDGAVPCLDDAGCDPSAVKGPSFGETSLAITSPAGLAAAANPSLAASSADGSIRALLVNFPAGLRSGGLSTVPMRVGQGKRGDDGNYLFYPNDETAVRELAGARGTWESATFSWAFELVLGAPPGFVVVAPVDLIDSRFEARLTGDGQRLERGTLSGFIARRQLAAVALAEGSCEALDCASCEPLEVTDLAKWLECQGAMVDPAREEAHFRVQLAVESELIPAVASK